MIFSEPLPFEEAVRRATARTPMAAALTSQQWAALPLALRERAFFSATVDDMRVLAAMRRKLDQALTLGAGEPERAFVDRSKFIAEMRQLLDAREGNSGQLTDLTSAERLGLIYDFNIEDAYSYGRWQAGQDAELLDVYPAQELVRVEAREKERDWPERWAAAGGQFFGGRMIARKDDPVWERISRFGRPWPPFDYGSGMGLEDIDRDEAEALGVIGPRERVEPQQKDFNDALSASVAGIDDTGLAALKAVFGDQVELGRDGRATWQGSRIQRLYETALADPKMKWDLDLGTATAAAVAQAPELAGASLHITSDDVRHIQKRHGPGRERQGDQRPVTPLDLQLIPHVWRAATRIAPGTEPGTLEFYADFAGWKTLVAFDRAVAFGAPASTRWGVKTMWAKREGVQP